MPEIMEQVLAILLPSLATLIAGWFAVLGAKIKTVYTDKINTQTKKEVAEITANYVQQVYYALDGEQKLQKAMEQASLILKRYPCIRYRIKNINRISCIWY